MKISKKQLKTIIKEEKSKLLRETMRDDYAEMGNFDRYSGMLPDRSPENDPKLYVNLSDDQLAALDALQDAVTLCYDARVPVADVMDTVKAGIGD